MILVARFTFFYFYCYINGLRMWLCPQKWEIPINDIFCTLTIFLIHFYSTHISSKPWIVLHDSRSLNFRAVRSKFIAASLAQAPALRRHLLVALITKLPNCFSMRNWKNKYFIPFARLHNPQFRMINLKRAKKFAKRVRKWTGYLIGWLT